MKFSFEMPAFLHWIVPNRERDQQRAAVTGSASRSYLFGMITITFSERA